MGLWSDGAEPTWAHREEAGPGGWRDERSGGVRGV